MNELNTFRLWSSFFFGFLRNFNPAIILIIFLLLGIILLFGDWRELFFRLFLFFIFFATLFILGFIMFFLGNINCKGLLLKLLLLLWLLLYLLWLFLGSTRFLYLFTLLVFTLFFLSFIIWFFISILTLWLFLMIFIIELFGNIANACPIFNNLFMLSA